MLNIFAGSSLTCRETLHPRRVEYIDPLNEVTIVPGYLALPLGLSHAPRQLTLSYRDHRELELRNKYRVLQWKIWSNYRATRPRRRRPISSPDPNPILSILVPFLSTHHSGRAQGGCVPEGSSPASLSSNATTPCAGT